MFVNLIPLLSLSGSVFVRNQGLEAREETGPVAVLGASPVLSAVFGGRKLSPSLLCSSRHLQGWLTCQAFASKLFQSLGNVEVEFFPLATLKGWREPSTPGLAGAEAKQTPSRTC